MNNKIIFAVLTVLLLVSAGLAAYFFQSGSKSAASLEQKIASLEQEKIVLQKKIGKGLAYADLLDLFFEPARKESGLPSRRNLDEVQWLGEFSKAAKGTGDAAVGNVVQELAAGGSEAGKVSVYFMCYTAGAIADSLK